jgi:hypothetical protein
MRPPETGGSFVPSVGRAFRHAAGFSTVCVVRSYGVSTAVTVFGAALFGGSFGAAVSAGGAVLVDSRRRSHDRAELLRRRMLEVADAFASDAVVLQDAVAGLIGGSRARSQVDEILSEARQSPDLHAPTLDWMHKVLQRAQIEVIESSLVVDVTQRLRTLLGPLELHFGSRTRVMLFANRIVTIGGDVQATLEFVAHRDAARFATRGYTVEGFADASQEHAETVETCSRLAAELTPCIGFLFAELRRQLGMRENDEVGKDRD